MNATSAIICKAFLLKCPQEKRERLFDLLPPEQRAVLQEVPLSFYRDPTLGIVPIEERLAEIHFSWFAPVFRTFSENEIRLFMAALSPQQSKELKKLILFTNQAAPVNTFALPFLQKALWGKIASSELLPVECLPDSPLNHLLELSVGELVALVDLLGVHDLAVEVRQIIETSKLKQIYAALTSAELSLLKNLLHHREALAFKRFPLQKWDGSKATLRTLIRQRGFNRLGKALYRNEQSLLWHISHRLDMEMGEYLIKLTTPLEHVRAQELIINQVVELIPLIQRNAA